MTSEADQSKSLPMASSVVVLDFETTGLSPDAGDRAIEIGAVRVENGEITDRFQELMNPGRRVDAFIEDYTGISNEMLEDAAPCSEVMDRFADFVGDDNLVAHNASFDKRFLDTELERISRSYTGEFACSLLMARRILQDAPNHKLGTLVKFTNIPSDGTFHRALYDSEMTAQLWIKMLENIGEHYDLFDLSFEFVQRLCKIPKANIAKFLANSAKT